MRISKDDSSGDVVLEFQQGGSTSYIMGLDDSDSNLFKIHSGSELIDTSDFKIDTTGNVFITQYIELAQVSAPSPTKNKLYNVSGNLIWDGITLNGSSGSANLDALSDVKGHNASTFSNSLVIGNTATNGSGAANNIAVGSTSLSSITWGFNNSAIGHDAGASLTQASNDVFIGYRAGYTTTDVDKAVLIGSNAGKDTLEGDSAGDCDGTIAIGYYAASEIRYAKANTIIGYESFKVCEGNSSNENLGASCTAIGYQTLYSETGNTLGYKNTAIGSSALYTCDEVKENTAVGYKAGYSVTGSDFITLVGAQAGEQITNCQRTLCIGYDSGQEIETGDDSIFIGYENQAEGNNNDFEIVIGASITGKGANTTFIGGTSEIWKDKSGNTWDTSSDKRLKKNIINCDIGLEELDKLKIIKYQFKKKEDIPKKFNIDSEKIYYGVSAQDARKVIPSIIREDEDGWLVGMNTDPIMWCTIRSVQELYDKYKINLKKIKERENIIECMKLKQHNLEKKYLKIIEKLNI